MLKIPSDYETTEVVKNPLDPAELQAAIDKVHRAGMPGVFAEVRDGDQIWRGAAGIADVSNGRPVTPDMRHRVGSISKTFTAAAVLQQVESGQIGLDTPIGHYLPTLVPGGRGQSITVRMLINHTSGLAEYLPYAYPSLKAFPSLKDTTPKSLDDNRFRKFHPAGLIEMGVAAPAVSTPSGTPGIYSNTNYQLLCQLLELVTGTTAEKYITQNVIERAGLRDTELPAEPQISGPHSQMYEAWFGMIDPPRDYSIYDMSWVGPAASLISTVADLNRFYGLLLGLQKMEVPGHGTFWGHEGTVWGAGATSMTRADGKRQMSVAVNFMRWNKLDSSGKLQHHPIDDALPAFCRMAMLR